jgi:hypothetical protein
MRDFLIIGWIFLISKLVYAAEDHHVMMGEVNTSDDSRVILSLKQQESNLLLKVTISRSDKREAVKEVDAWILTKNGAYLRQVEKTHGLGVFSKEGFTAAGFGTGFEKQPLTGIVAIVVSVDGKLLTFERNSNNPDGPRLEIVKGPQRNEPRRNPPARPFPEGDYLVSLERWNAQQTVTIRVKENKAEVIKSSEPRLMGMKGDFKPHDTDEFFIFFETKASGPASQYWKQQPDGSYVIKEVPDEGQKQRALLIPKTL